jgi:nucleoside-diphosphate-sugar epimerase
MGSLDVRIGDIRDQSLVQSALKDTDLVIHLASINGTVNFYDKPREVMDVAISGIQNILAGMEMQGVPDLYLASSSEVYQNPGIFPTPENVPLIVPDPFNPRYSYGLGKIVQEFLSIHAGNFLKNLVVFRPHNVYGPDMGFQHVIPEICANITLEKNSNVTLKGNGLQTRSFCHISDFVNGFELILDSKHGRDTFNIGTREEITISHLAGVIATSLGREIIFSCSDAPLGETNRRLPDISKLENLGFRQKISIDDGVKEYCNWYLSTLY